MENRSLETLVSKANEALEAVQSLQLQPTEHNVTRIATAIHDIQEMFNIAHDIADENSRMKENANKEPAVTEEEV